MERSEPGTQGETRYDPSSLVALVIGLGAQAQILLGVIENPITKQKEEVDLERARNFIDLLAMLDEKTKGNRTDEESAFLDRILADLRMRWVDAQKSAG